MEKETGKNDAEHSSFKRRLSELEKDREERTKMLIAMERQGNAIEKMGEKVDGIAQSMGRVEKRVDQIEHEPAENAKRLKYEVIKYIVLAVVGVVVGYFIKV